MASKLRDKLTVARNMLEQQNQEISFLNSQVNDLHQDSEKLMSQSKKNQQTLEDLVAKREEIRHQIEENKRIHKSEIAYNQTRFTNLQHQLNHLKQELNKTNQEAEKITKAHQNYVNDQERQAFSLQEKIIQTRQWIHNYENQIKIQQLQNLTST